MLGRISTNAGQDTRAIQDWYGAGSPSPFDSKETSAIHWATLDEAVKLIGMTTNKIGQARDLSVLGAVRLAFKSSIQDER
jgi:hypothetical protein